MEWVRPVDEGAVARLLALPPGVRLLAYIGLGIPQEFHQRTRRGAGDWRAQRRRESRVYRNLWRQTGGSLVAFMPRLTSPTARHSWNRPEAEDASCERGR